MKKTAVLAVIAGACFLLAACGSRESGNVSGIGDPYALAGEQVDAQTWSAAAANDNVTVKTIVTAENKNGDTMSESVTVIYRIAGERAYVETCSAAASGLTVCRETYLEFGEGISAWERVKAGGGDFSEWRAVSRSGAGAPRLLSPAGGFACLAEKFECFAYSEEERGYLATQEGLASLKGAYRAADPLALLPDAGSYGLGKFVVKFADGKPAACLARLERERRTAFFLGPRFPLRLSVDRAPMSEIDPDETDALYGTCPRLILEIRLPFPGREAEALRPSAFEVAQIYYDYGRTKVARPKHLPQAAFPSAVFR